MNQSKPIIIAHRANLNGPDTNDNHPTAILTALQEGYDIEIDTWITNHQLHTGHDHPQHPLPPSLKINNPHIWWHAKNTTALDHLLQHGANTFWHQHDDRVITSHGLIWCHKDHPHHSPHSVILLFTIPDITNWNRTRQQCHAICTDHPRHLKELLNNN
jgi:hypothetical protein